MNKKNQQLIPVCIIGAVIVFVAILFFMCQPRIAEYSELTTQRDKIKNDKERYEQQVEQAKSELQAEEMKLKALKPIYETNVNINDNNLGVFGNMFEDIIKTAQNNGLLIRSIEYNMNPASDPIYMVLSNAYNVCELKFFFVGSYLQLKSFFNDMNKNFPNLTSISKLNVTAFTENTDYLLINESITLYSRKPESVIKSNQENSSRPRRGRAAKEEEEQQQQQ